MHCFNFSNFHWRRFMQSGIYFLTFWYLDKKIKVLREHVNVCLYNMPSMYTFIYFCIKYLELFVHWIAELVWYLLKMQMHQNICWKIWHLLLRRIFYCVDLYRVILIPEATKFFIGFCFWFYEPKLFIF